MVLRLSVLKMTLYRIIYLSFVFQTEVFTVSDNSDQPLKARDFWLIGLFFRA